MTSRLTRKLETFGPLPEDDRRFLDDLVGSPRLLRANEDIIREGDTTNDVHVVLEGFAGRYKVTEDGRRHIMALLVPGDMCDIHTFILKRMDHGIATLSPCQIADLPRSRVLEMLERPAVARALWCMTLVDEATLREWLVNLGQRKTEERVAHLFCELHLRLRAVGLANDEHFLLPLTQTDLADAMGASAIHMNRVIQSLRAKNLVAFEKGQLVILDIDELREMSGFNPNYLHLDEAKGSGPKADPARPRT